MVKPPRTAADKLVFARITVEMSKGTPIKDVFNLVKQMHHNQLQADTARLDKLKGAAAQEMTVQDQLSTNLAKAVSTQAHGLKPT